MIAIAVKNLSFLTCSCSPLNHAGTSDQYSIVYSFNQIGSTTPLHGLFRRLHILVIIDWGLGNSTLLTIWCFSNRTSTTKQASENRPNLLHSLSLSFGGAARNPAVGSLHACQHYRRYFRIRTPVGNRGRHFQLLLNLRISGIYQKHLPKCSKCTQGLDIIVSSTSKVHRVGIA